MRIPARQECYRIMHAMQMMDHIVCHSLQVCRIALFLSDSLKADIDRGLVQAAALLHDITKTRGLQTRENHAETGKQLLVDMGYPEVGAIVGQHVLLDEYFSSDSPTEAEIVNYADKRVVHDKVTTLSQRIEYIMGRYGTEPERRGYIRMMGEKTKRLEDRLFRFCPFSPEEVEFLLGPDTCSMEFTRYGELHNTLKEPLDTRKTCVRENV